MFRNVYAYVNVFLYKKVNIYDSGLWIYFDFTYVKENGWLIFQYFSTNPVFQPEGEKHALVFTLTQIFQTWNII